MVPRSHIHGRVRALGVNYVNLAHVTQGLEAAWQVMSFVADSNDHAQRKTSRTSAFRGPPDFLEFFHLPMAEHERLKCFGGIIQFLGPKAPQRTAGTCANIGASHHGSCAVRS